MAKHLVWDWNGTLLNDFDLTLAATNAVFAHCGGRSIVGDEHRRLFRRPISDFYAEVLGRPVSETEFSILDQVFHGHYHAGLTDCRLSDGALDALRDWAGRGSQSLLSMWFHDRLTPFVASFGINGYFARVDGLRMMTGGGSKAEYLVIHLAELGIAGPDCVLIGDTVDDARAAEAVGAGCVLVTGGFTDADRLRATGHPVVDSLSAAVRAAV